MRSSIKLLPEHHRQIEEGAAALLELLKDPSCELMGEGYKILKDKISPLFNSALAEPIIKKYNELFVNFSNAHNVTLLHLLILFAPRFAPLVVEDKSFDKINFKATSSKNKLSASALDMAISRWLVGECDYQLLELLLKYRAKVPVLMDSYFPGVTLPTGICLAILFNQTAKRTVEEAANLLALLGCYGYKIINEIEKFASTWFTSDSTHTARIEAIYGYSVFEQFEAVSNFKEAAIKRFIIVNKEAPEFLVPSTMERSAISASPRCYSQMRGFTLYANPAQEQSSLAEVVYGKNNRLLDEDKGIAALFALGK